VVHPSGRIFVVNEYRSTVSVFSFDPATAKMDEIAEVSTTGGDVDDGNVPSGLVLSPDMQWLYVGNRGRDSIAVLRIDDAGLSWAGEVAAGGEPRDLAFVGGHLYVANLMSGTVSVFGWQPGSGSLGLPLQIVEVPSPSCVIGL
jgi:6-phosphogluconolactonase